MGTWIILSVIVIGPALVLLAVALAAASQHEWHWGRRRAGRAGDPSAR